VIVRATSIRTTPRGPELSENPALSVGEEYLVLEFKCNVLEKHGRSF
jgi:hypothetical protein